MGGGDERAAVYFGGPLLADWWYWTGRIAKHQSRLKQVNGRHASRRLRRLYRNRQRRFRHGVNTFVRRFVGYCYRRDVSEAVLGDLRGIRENGLKGGKANAMVHSFWSHRYLLEIVSG